MNFFHCLLLSILILSHYTYCLYYWNATHNSIAWRRQKTEKYTATECSNQPSAGAKGIQLKGNWVYIFAFSMIQNCLQSIKKQTDILALKHNYVCISFKLLHSKTCGYKQQPLKRAKVFPLAPFTCVRPYYDGRKLQTERIFREITGSQLEKHLNFALGKECLTVSYKMHSTEYLLNTHRFFHKGEKMTFSFHTALCLGINITFQQFHLSPMCLGHSWTEGNEYSAISECYDHSDTEFVTVCEIEPSHYKHGYIMCKKTRRLRDSHDKKLLTFCMKRPQWSVYIDQGTFTALHYVFCQKCLNMTSTLVFSYQMISEGGFQVWKDDFRKELYGGQFKLISVTSYDPTLIHHMYDFFNTSHPYGVSCISYRSGCMKYVFSFLLRGQKHQTVTLAGFRHKYIEVYRMNDLIHQHIDEEVSSPVTVNYFLCHIQVHVITRSWYSNDNPADPDFSKKKITKDLKYKFLKTKSIAGKYSFNKEEHFHWNFSSKPCNPAGSCQWLFQVEAPEFIELKIHSIFYTGWKFFSCIFGGLTLLEPLNTDILHEIVSFCGNHMGKDSNGYGQSKTGVIDIILTSVSTGSNMFIVLNHLSTEQLNVSLNLRTTHCQGVFVNPCIDTFFPVSFKEKILLYPDSYSNSCVSYQFSAQYLWNGTIHDPAIYISGCTKFYFINQTSPIMSHHQVRFTGTIKYTNDTFFKSPVFGDAGFLFVSNVTQSSESVKSVQKLSCKENTSNVQKFVYRRKMEKNTKSHDVRQIDIKAQRIFDEAYYKYLYFRKSYWHRGLKMFNSVHRKFGNTSSTQFDFQANISLVRRADYFYDSIFMNIFGESKVNLMLLFLGFSNETLKHPSMFLVPNGTVCLRQPVKGVLERHYIIEVSCIGQNCSSGQIDIAASLCIETARKGAYDLEDKVLFRWCNPQKGLHEYRVQWQSSFNKEIFYFAHNRVFIDLPGKNLDSEIAFHPGTALSLLQCRWFSRTVEEVDLFDATFNLGKIYRYERLDSYELHGLLRAAEFSPSLLAEDTGMAIFSRNLQTNYDEPNVRTWHEANSVCTEANFELPHITSNEHLLSLVDLVRRASKDGLVTNIFIGLYREVRGLNVLHCAWIGIIHHCKQWYIENFCYLSEKPGFQMDWRQISSCTYLGCSLLSSTTDWKILHNNIIPSCREHWNPVARPTVQLEGLPAEGSETSAVHHWKNRWSKLTSLVCHVPTSFVIKWYL